MSRGNNGTKNGRKTWVSFNSLINFNTYLYTYTLEFVRTAYFSHTCELLFRQRQCDRWLIYIHRILWALSTYTITSSPVIRPSAAHPSFLSCRETAALQALGESACSSCIQNGWVSKENCGCFPRNTLSNSNSCRHLLLRQQHHDNWRRYCMLKSDLHKLKSKSREFATALRLDFTRNGGMDSQKAES